MGDFVTLPATGTFTLRDASVPACLLGRDGELVRATIGVAEGRIAAPAGEVVDMGGAMVLPCPVDMHTHLDKGHIWPRTPNPDGSFDGALTAVRGDKTADPRRWGADDLAARMRFGLRSAHAHGTAAIRTHLDWFPDNEATPPETSWEVFAALRDEWAGRIALQASALTGADLAADPAMLARCADTVGRHGGVLGAVTYPEADLDLWLGRYVAAATERGLDLDFHVDETLDPGVNTLRQVARAVLDARFPGRVTVGHLCSLSAMPEATALETLDLVARAGLHVVSLPMCNLYLQDRHADRTPRMRGVTLVHEMAARGIPVSFASDNTRDPFYAYGDLDMIEVLREATRIAHLDHSRADWMHAFTTNPATACGFAAPSLATGAPADLIVLHARSWTELMARPQSDRVVIRAGRAIDRTLPDYAELDHLMEAS